MKIALRLGALAMILFIGDALVSPSINLAADARGKLLKRAENETRKGEFEKAEETYRGLLATDAQDKEAQLGLSFVKLKQSRLQECYDLATAVLQVQPLNARAHSLVGTSLLRSGEFRTSQEALYTAVKLDERQALAYAGLSEIEYFENRSRNAYDGLRKAVSLDPNEPDYYVALARACSRMEFYTEAAEAYQRFLEVAPKADEEKRARIRGLIQFYRYLGTTRIHRPAGKEQTTVKFDLIRYRPFVNVMINGKGPLRFVIDTGASLSVVSDATATKLGIKPVSRGGNARAVGGTGSFPIIYGVLDSMAVGDVKIESIPVYIRTVHHSDDAPPNERADGYIGLSMLSNFLVTIDYQKRELVLDRRQQTETPVIATAPNAGDAPLAPSLTTDLTTATEVPIRSTSGGLASTETLLPNLTRPLNFIIDTGATTTVVSKAVVSAHNLQDLKIKGETYRVIGAAGVETDVEALGLSALNVSGLRKQNSRALILDLTAVNETSGFEQHGILGGDYLSHFLVRLDLRHYQLRLTPQTKAITLASDASPEKP